MASTSIIINSIKTGIFVLFPIVEYFYLFTQKWTLKILIYYKLSSIKQYLAYEHMTIELKTL